jgi:hypothetical protein
MPVRRKKRDGCVSYCRFAILLGAFLAMVPLASAQSPESDGTDSGDPSVISSPQSTTSSPSLWIPLKPQSQFQPYDPLTSSERLRWLFTNTLGPQHLLAGVLAAGFGTAINRPNEYGSHWKGWADRYNMRLSGVASSNAMEDGVGYLLHEDPRYFSARGLPFAARLRNVLRLTFIARRDDGSYGPAYARYAAISGNNFLTNAWRVRSEANAQSALIRIGEGFASQLVANAFEEFWPSVKLHVFHRGE